MYLPVIIVLLAVNILLRTCLFILSERALSDGAA
jgi:hypothetical protein